MLDDKMKENLKKFNGNSPKPVNVNIQAENKKFVNGLLKFVNVNDC